MFDSIIIGGGIAGLLTAIRLSMAGKKVLVIDKDKIGSGSTSSNHGMVHSGALYTSQHGHIVKQCQEAQKAFSELLHNAEIPCNDSVYISSLEKLNQFTSKLDTYGYSYKYLSNDAVPELNKKALKKYKMISIKERIFSSEEILKILTSHCLNNNVSFLLGIKINNLLISEGKIKGINYGLNKVITSSNVIIACGLGTTQLLRSFRSYYCKWLKSRLDMMVYLPHASLKRGLIFADLDKPILMPAINNSSLGSYFGGIQPIIQGDRKFAVDFDKAKDLIDMINLYFNKELVNSKDSHLYMCGKTDFTGSKHTEKGFINPGFHIIDHHQYDKIEGLYTIITGKMTLAFHASREVCEKILKTKLELVIPDKKVIQLNKDMFTVAPWKNVSEI